MLDRWKKMPQIAKRFPKDVEHLTGSLNQHNISVRLLQVVQLRTVPTNSKVFLPRFMIMQEM